MSRKKNQPYIYHMIKPNDKYGYLTIISDTGKRKNNGEKIWLCKCECGNEVERSSDSIRQSTKKNCIISCGCKKARDVGMREKDNAKRKDLARKSLVQMQGTTMQGILFRGKQANKNSHTGVKGVNLTAPSKLKKGYKPYRARIMLKGKEITIGYYNTIEEAKYAREKAEEELYQPIVDEYLEEKANE